MPYWKTLLVTARLVMNIYIPCVHKGELFLLNLTVHTRTLNIKWLNYTKYDFTSVNASNNNRNHSHTH